jgi:uncharacterized membrane protein
VVLFTGSGLLHLVRPGVYTPIVPDLLPAHRLLVIVSGVAELACAVGLVWRRTRRLAGWASIALLVAIFPANVTMAVHAGRSWWEHDGGGWYFAGTVARLPLQLPLIWWAWRLTVEASAPGGSGSARGRWRGRRPPRPG